MVTELKNRGIEGIYIACVDGLKGFPEAILKIMYLALQNISKKWTMPIRNWPAAMNQFAIKYEERFPL